MSGPTRDDESPDYSRFAPKRFREQPPASTERPYVPSAPTVPAPRTPSTERRAASDFPSWPEPVPEPPPPPHRLEDGPSALIGRVALVVTFAAVVALVLIFALIQAYCSVFRGGRLVTSADDPAIPCRPDEAGYSQTIKGSADVTSGTAAALETVPMLIGGELRASAERRDDRCAQPGDRRAARPDPARRRGRRRRRRARGRRRVPGLARDARRRARPAASSSWPTPSIERKEELALLDAADNGSPIREHAHRRRDRRRRAALLRRARAAGARRDDPDGARAPQLHAARAVRRGRADRPVQPPADVRRR